MHIATTFGADGTAYFVTDVNPTIDPMGAEVPPYASAVQTDKAVQALDGNPYA